MIALLSGGLGGRAATISDDFNDGNDNAGSIVWQRYDPIAVATSGQVVLGTWSFPGGNTYRLQTAPSPDPSTFGQARIGSIAPGNFTNFYVAVDVVNWDDTIHQLFGVLARVGNVGPGSTTGYLFNYDRGDPTSSTSGDMDIVRIDNELPTDLDNKTYFGTDSVHLQTGHSYRFVFMGVGDTFRGQVYDLTNTALPIVDYGATDPLYDPTASDHVSGRESSSRTMPRRRMARPTLLLTTFWPPTGNFSPPISHCYRCGSPLKAARSFPGRESEMEPATCWRPTCRAAPVLQFLHGHP